MAKVEGAIGRDSGGSLDSRPARVRLAVVEGICCCGGVGGGGGGGGSGREAVVETEGQAAAG